MTPTRETGSTHRRIATIGMFDGVHNGHMHLLHQLQEKAAELDARPIVLTFRRHPANFLSSRTAPSLITEPSLRRDLILAACPNAECIVMDFSTEDFRATASEFIAMLQKKHGISALMMGFNNHIGCDRLTAEELKAAIGQQNENSSFQVFEATPFGDDSHNSTTVRDALSKADFATAQSILGHYFTVRGTVVHGKQLGRKLGYPTANIEPLAAEQLLPPNGVYAVQVHVKGSTYTGMANIGTRPSVDDGNKRSFEVHIIGFDSDIYGETIDIDILHRIRDEHHFPDLAALAMQLEKDRKEALRLIPADYSGQ